MKSLIQVFVLCAMVMVGSGWSFAAAATQTVLPQPMQVTIKGLPEFVDPGQDYEVVVVVEIKDSKIKASRAVTISILCDTPFGDGVILRETIVMDPGQIHEIPLKLRTEGKTGGGFHTLKAMAETGPHMVIAEQSFTVL